jgi:hypothetical protein
MTLQGVNITFVEKMKTEETKEISFTFVHGFKSTIQHLYKV